MIDEPDPPGVPGSAWFDPYPSTPETTPAPRAPMVHREHILQKHTISWLRSAIDLVWSDWQVFAFDRAGASGRFTHVRQAAAGLVTGTPDTLLEIRGFPGIWWELKDRGKRPDETQLALLAKLRSIGRHAGWGCTVTALHDFLVPVRVPLVANARFQAMIADGAVEAEIARKTGAAPKTRKAARKPKPEPRFTMGKRATAAHRAKGHGV